MVDVSRRAVIRGGIGVLGIAAVGFGDVAVGGRAVAAPARSDYAASIGQLFDATIDGRTSSVRLTRADDVTPTREKGRSESFILLFEPDSGPRLDDGIYSVRRRGVPAHDLFMSGVGSGSTLQAVVNRAV